MLPVPVSPGFWHRCQHQAQARIACVPQDSFGTSCTTFPKDGYPDERTTSSMSNAFHNKVAVVTGGSAGIGHATARKIAEGGGTVYITGRDQDAATAAAADIPGDVIGVRADSRSTDDITRAVSTARWSSSVHSRSVVVGLVLTLSQGSSPHVGCRCTSAPAAGASVSRPAMAEPTPVSTCVFPMETRLPGLLWIRLSTGRNRIRQVNTEPLI